MVCILVKPNLVDQKLIDQTSTAQQKTAKRSKNGKLKEKINFSQSNYLTCHVKQKNSLGKIKLFQFEWMDIKVINLNL
ncbi:hypothetical protein BpHYR1_039613 [Brachionus plicatilis]|uniref:Uncharacterized protein n=1 Tax=Brachionus plicatilis TaxID=10195 RepID=A0A3M7RHQ9_BRAPC|nr:hypothetical protein BpHYR1_039613 [Brachionus plicatilis]